MVVPSAATATRGAPRPIAGPASVLTAPNGPPGGRIAVLIVWLAPLPSRHATTSVPSLPNATSESLDSAPAPGTGPAGSQLGAACAAGASTSASPSATSR